MRIPDFFIVGAPKCGTTSMYAYLKQHPDVYMPEQKEPHFFGSDLLETPYFVRDKESYLAFFADARNETRVGEASISYLYSRRAAQEIREFCPRADIIIMLRNPIDMMYSLHSQRLQSGNENIIDFEAALGAEADRKRGMRIPRGAQEVHGLLYREMASYTSQVERYLRVFGQEHVHVIIFDDLRAHTPDVYRQTLRFLGVDETFRPEFHVVNPNRRVRVRAVASIIRDPFVRTLARSLMPLATRERVKRAIRRLNTEPGSRPPIDPELRLRLQAEFAPEVRRLSELLGRDLTHWSSSDDPRES